MRFELTNALQMSWTTLLDVLFDRLGGIWTSVADNDVAAAIFELSPVETNELEEYLKEIFENRLVSPRHIRA